MRGSFYRRTSRGVAKTRVSRGQTLQGGPMYRPISNYIELESNQDSGDY